MTADSPLKSDATGKPTISATTAYGCAALALMLSAGLALNTAWRHHRLHTRLD